MAISAGDFEAYFQSVNGGHQPFAWQRRLLDTILRNGRWPDAIVAPTGAGKSSVVDIHVFVTALAAVGAAPRLPRRMAVVVNRRALVDKHLERARALAGRLDGAAGGVLGEVASALASLTDGETTLLHASLRGGLRTLVGREIAEWIDDPRVPAVIAATPDMWGSRLLFRGYGTSRLARPREAGMLALDSVMILDEAHLNRQLLKTARDVAALVARDSGELGVPGLQIVETTATPAAVDEQRTRVGVEESDLDDPGIGPRLRAAKTVSVIESVAVPTKMPPSDVYVAELAAQAGALAEEVEQTDGLASTVLCVVNNVDTAVRLAAKLSQGRTPKDVVCWVGRMRPMDLQRMREDRPGLFTIEGDPDARFLVATQTVEVGVDLDCAAMLTELAPRSALIQRLGRVNRLGRRSNSPVRVVVPAGEMVTDRPPYRVGDLRAARDWLDAHGSDGDVGPWTLTQQAAPVESVPRRFLSSLHAEHAELLANTTEELFEEPELVFWLRDDFDEPPDPVSVILRSLLPEEQRKISRTDPFGTLREEDLAVSLLLATPPDGREAFPILPGRARTLVERVLEAPDLARAFLWRDGDLQQIDRSHFGEGFPFRPGDVIVLDDAHAVLGKDFLIGVDPTAEARTAWGAEGVSVVFPYADRELCSLLAGLRPEEAQHLYTETTGSAAQVVLPPPAVVEDAAVLPWVVLKEAQVVTSDTEIRQEWTTNQTPVPLDDHQHAVGDHAARWGRSIGLPESIVAALEMAGLHHDDGKQDLLFQLDRLENADPTVPLAKSTSRSAQQIRRNFGAARLPQRWRHEQLSAAYAWTVLQGEVNRGLVARLAGTSHGHGRPFFPHGASGLVGTRYEGEVAAAVDVLFRTGEGWSRVLSRTEREWGVWGCAYLEAILRAADCRVSRNGS